ncbi:hypothetical protein FOCC_FOCC009021, partial [Frankliniella occidentalis]
GGSLPGTGGVPSADSSRRESSSSLPAAGTGTGTAASSKDSLLSMDSTSTLQDGCSGCSSDDSVILSRIRRSTEQKEEFLRRPAQPIWPVVEPQQLQAAPQQKGVREFYARPQKLQKPVWPPASERDVPEAAAEDRDGSRGGGGGGGGGGTTAGEAPNFVAGGAVGGPLAARANKSYFSTLSRIQENQPSVSSTGSEDTVMNGDSTSLPSSCSSRGAEENQPHLPVIHLVSRRARHFEAGEEEDITDRTSFYKSELARLSAKKGVPEVAVRKREFESRSLQENSSLKKLEKAGSPPANSSIPPSAVSGNRSIPIGSSKLHCDPPPDYKPSPEDLLYGSVNHTQPSSLKIRIRSRSADPSHYDQRNKAVRQESYLNAVSSDRKRQAVISTVLEEEREGSDVSPSPAPKILAPDPSCSTPTSPPIRPNQLPIANPLRPASYPQRNSIGDPEGLVQGLKGQPRAIDTSTVVRRQKDTSSIDEDRSTRRVSYLKATWNDRMHVDSDLELSDTEPTPSVAQRRLNRKWRPPLFPDDIQRLKRLFEDAAAAATGHSISLHQGSAARSGAAVATTAGSGSSPRGSPRTSSTKDSAPGLLHRDREGWLHCKITFIDGKRATDRSWKQVWATVRGSELGLYKERPPETPLGSEGAGGAGDHIDLRCSLVEVAADYTKKKHVLRLNSASGSELLLQADTGADLLQWVRVLQDQAGDPGGPTAATADGLAAGSSPVQGLSPTVAHKGIKKLTALRNRSPTGAAAAAAGAQASSGSSAGKARKQSQPAQFGALPLPLPTVPSPSPKSKTWKGRVAKQFRKMHTGSSNGGNSPSSPTAPHAQQHVEGVTIGVPLEDCPPSTFCEAVPLLVELCTSIVEARGLEVIGIYRVPGNTAAVASLTESINKGFDFVNLQDPRWGDVNVISSLLKSFFRRLPDSLFTTELYPSFIEADKIDNPIKRVQAIRKLIRELPEHHYETLKYLLFHLKQVVDHSHTNKMEARNLAIVFGPTLVRAGDDNMVTMVTDMSSQCRIVETLISNVDWFFSEDDSEEFSLPSSEVANTSLNLSSSDAAATASSASSQNQSLLLGNIHKVEGLKAESPSKDVSARDIVSSIITAANRKIQRGKSKKSESDHNEHKQVTEVVHRQKTKDHSNSGFMSDPDSPPSSESLKQKRCSLTDPMRIHVEPNVSEDVKTSNETVVPVTSIPTITTSSPKTTASLALRYKSPGSDDVAIMSYANLAQTTQERIKRFEQETKAMLERDLYRQNRDSQQWDEQRKQIERQWLEAKQELEADDALDSVIGISSDKKSAADKLRVDSVRSLLSSTSSSGSASGGATPPQRSSWRVGWGSRLSSVSNTSNSASSLIGNVHVTAPSNQQDAQNNGHLKRMKTGKEPRSGSLDSLQGAPAGERPQSHMSDEGGDLLATLTSTFDQKMKSLLGTNKPTSGTSKPSTTKSVSQSNSSSPSAPKSAKSSNSVTSAAATVQKEDKVDAASDASDRLHLLNCDDDIPFADTDATELEARGPQALPKPVSIQTQEQSSPTALLTYRDPSLHRASRILRSSTVPDNPTTLDNKETSDNLGTKCSPLRWSTPVNVSECNFVSESGRTLLEKKPDSNMLSGGGVNNSEVVGSASNSPVKSIVTTGSAPVSGPINMQCDKLIMSDSTKKSDCFQSSTKLKRSESLNKSSDRSDSVVNSKLRRSESLNKNDRSEMSLSVKLRRSESLNKSEKSDSKLKRSDSLTKTEKTESNMNRRRQQENRANARGNCGGNANIRDKETTKMFIQNATLVLTKLKRKNGMPERSIKRRHTVGGTKDFDKLHWLDNRLQSDQWESNNSPVGLKEKKSLRTSSPDLSSSRLAGILVEVSLLHSGDVHRPHSLPDPNLVSAVFKVPLESHV